MRNAVLGTGVAFLLAVAVHVPAAHAQTNNLQTLLETLQSLMQQVEDLQARLAELRGEIHETIAEGLEEGMTHDDIREIQELLATDKDIYPEGLTTGYFGRLTSQALRRFQERFDLEVTGTLTDETREALAALKEDRRKNSGRVAPGLLHAPGLKDKFTKRLRLHCKDDAVSDRRGHFCDRYDFKFDHDEDDEHDHDEHDHDDDDEHEEDEGNVEEAAEEQIDSAQAAIDFLEAALDEANADDDGVEEAEEALESALEYLALAEEKFDNDMFEEAEAKADKAEDEALEGIEELGLDYEEDEEGDDDEEDEDEEDDDGDDS